MKLIITEGQFDKLIEMAYPSHFNMQEFKNLKSFSQRMNYCNQHLRRMTSGSGRVIYQIDDEKVLKLAKNQKGIAQNSVESEEYIQSYSIAAHVFETGENDTFVEMELARKVSPSIFRSVVGFDFKYVGPYLYNRFEAGKRSRLYSGGVIPKKDIPLDIEKMLDEDEWMGDLGSLIGDYDMPIGDVGRLNSYGLVKRDGQDAVVLVDFGLTNSVYDEYYK